MINTPLKRQLFERQMSVTELAEKTGISYSNLTLIVNGKRVPSLENAIRIARVLCVNVEELWGYVVEE